MLLDEGTLRKLERLALVARDVRVGIFKGDRRSSRKGASVEFADYREYAPGDDLHRLDWNVYARLQRPFVKLLEAEEDLAVHILLDASGSMDWPRGASDPHNKFVYATRLAAALGYIALASGDSTHVTQVFGSEGARRWGPFRGHRHGLHLFRFLEAGVARDQTDLTHSLRDYALRAGRPGLLILLSDMLSPGGFEDGIDALLARGYEVAVLQILAPEELRPSLWGDLRLLDVETGSQAEVTLDQPALAGYERQLAGWLGRIQEFCHRRGLPYATIATSEPWDNWVLRTLRQQGVVT